MRLNKRGYRAINSMMALAALSSLCLLSGCGNPQGGPGGAPGGPMGGPPPTPEVSVIAVAQQAVTLSTELPGRISGYLVAEIRPQVSGLIQKRLFTEGADVKAGDVLYQIDPAPFQAAYDSAAANLDAMKKGADRARAALGASQANIEREKATVALARTDLGRTEDLLKDKAVSTSDRDHAATNVDVAEATLRAVEAEVESDKAGIAAAEAGIAQAKAAVESARINMSYTKIVAPIAGRVGRSTVTDGAIVTAYQPLALATIQALDPIYVDVTQSTTDVARLRDRIEKGHLQDSGTEQKKVKLLLEDGAAYPSEGTLSFRDVSVDQTTGSVILRIVVANPQGVLLPGMFIRAVVEEGVVDKAILVPQQAVSRDPKGTPLAMLVGAEDKVEPRPLVVERAVGDQWLVTSGLAVGDRVIVEGLQKARPGAVVKAVPFDAAKTNKASAGGAPQSAPKAN